jgi:hypothetical protein
MTDMSIPWDLQLMQQLQAETHAMLRHALANGLELPPALLAAVLNGKSDADGLMPLAALHAQLVRIVAPARPGTLRLLQSQVEQGRFAAVLGPLVNIRRLTVAATVFVLSFVLISISPLIDGRALALNVYELSGLQQLVVTGFLLAAAGMGSAFQALFTALGYVSRATYDPVYDASYWIRISLGLVAGLMLAVLVPVDSDGQSTAAFGRPVLALLGGFSVQLVHRVLQRTVDTVQSLFDGDPAEHQGRGQALSRVAAQQDAAQAHIELAAQLVQLQDLLAQGATPEQLQQALAGLTRGLLTARGTKVAPSPPESHNA